MSETADILVIGGGMAGISAAARLSGEARVIVLEQEDTIGSHSTGRSAAMFVLNYGNAVLRSLNAASAPFFTEPGDFCEGPLLSPRGELLVADEAEVPLLDALLAETSGIEPIAADEAVALVPILRRYKIAAAAYEADAQDIDVDLLLQGFLRLLRGAGGRVVTKAGAEMIRFEGGVWQVETPAGNFTAPILVNAAGAWADRVAALAGVPRVGLQPMRRSAVLVPAPQGYDITHWPLFASAGEAWYGKPQSGLLMISPADEDPVEPHDAWPEDMVLAEGIDRFERRTTMQVTRVERSWAGLRSFTPDRTPVVGFAPEAEGFFWLAGQGGYGIQTAPGMSQLSADLILGRTPSLAAATVAALAPGRAALT